MKGAGYINSGWDGWTEIGPIDLDDIQDLDWGTANATELWLLFKAVPIRPPEPVDIRIGWVKLEEGP